jgi:ribonuclease PH
MLLDVALIVPQSVPSRYYQRETRRAQSRDPAIYLPLHTSINRSGSFGRMHQLDCDVLQADGGTRIAAITGGSICNGWDRVGF